MLVKTAHDVVRHGMWKHSPRFVRLSSSTYAGSDDSSIFPSLLQVLESLHHSLSPPSLSATCLATRPNNSSGRSRISAIVLGSRCNLCSNDDERPSAADCIMQACVWKLGPLAP